MQTSVLQTCKLKPVVNSSSCAYLAKLLLKVASTILDAGALSHGPSTHVGPVLVAENLPRLARQGDRIRSVQLGLDLLPGLLLVLQSDRRREAAQDDLLAAHHRLQHEDLVGGAVWSGDYVLKGIQVSRWVAEGDASEASHRAWMGIVLNAYARTGNP